MAGIEIPADGQRGEQKCHSEHTAHAVLSARGTPGLSPSAEMADGADGVSGNERNAVLERDELDLLAEVDRLPVVELGAQRLPRIDPECRKQLLDGLPVDGV